MSQIDDKLFKTRFVPDDRSHLRIVNFEICREKCWDKVCSIMCPADVYRWEEEQMTINYEGCLECGTCKYGCPFNNIDWHNPRGGFGVMYKFG